MAGWMNELIHTVQPVASVLPHTHILTHTCINTLSLFSICVQTPHTHIILQVRPSFLPRLPVSSASLFEPWGSCTFLNCWGWMKFTTWTFHKAVQSDSQLLTDIEWYRVVFADRERVSRCKGCEILWLMMNCVFKMSEVSKEEGRAKQHLRKNILVESWNLLACSLPFSTWDKTIALLSLLPLLPSIPASSVSSSHPVWFPFILLRLPCLSLFTLFSSVSLPLSPNLSCH